MARDPELVNAHAVDGFQPLGLSCFFGRHETAEFPINSPSRNALGAAPLQSAAAAGHTKTVLLLLEYGADPNTREHGGYTPLHAAAQIGDLTMFRSLIFSGGDINLAGKDGKLPIDLANEGGHTRAADLIREAITRRFRRK